MKFRNGYWRLQDGYSLLGNADFIGSEEDESSVTLYWASRKIDSILTDSLNTPLITTRLSSPRRNVIRVDTAHFLGGRPQKPCFEPYAEETDVIISKECFVTGSLEAHFGKEGLSSILAESSSRSARRGFQGGSSQHPAMPIWLSTSPQA